MLRDVAVSEKVLEVIYDTDDFFVTLEEIKGMKFYLIIFFITSAAFSQTQTSEEALYWEAYNIQHLYYENGMLDKSFFGNDQEKIDAKRGIDSLQQIAHNIYTRFIDLYPKSELMAGALYEKGTIEFWDNDLVEAESSFKKVLSTLKSDYYKNESVILLAEIAIKQDNYEKALLYLDESKLYKKQHTCGTEYEVDRRRLERMYAKCNEALDKNKQ